MSSSKPSVVCKSISLLLVCSFVATASSEEQAQHEQETEKVKSSHEVPLNQKSIMLQRTEKQKVVSVPVTLRRTGRFTKPVRYQLHGMDGSTEYSWEVSLPAGGTGWKLFNGGAGTNYLAWVSGYDVGIKEISRLTHSKVEKHLTLQLNRFLSRKYLGATLSRSAIHTDTEILSVQKDKDGVLRVKVRDPINDQIFHFSFDGTTWRGYTSKNVELPPKWDTGSGVDAVQSMREQPGAMPTLAWACWTVAWRMAVTE